MRCGRPGLELSCVKKRDQRTALAPACWPAAIASDCCTLAGALPAARMREARSRRMHASTPAPGRVDMPVTSCMPGAPPRRPATCRHTLKCHTYVLLSAPDAIHTCAALRHQTNAQHGRSHMPLPSCCSSYNPLIRWLQHPQQIGKGTCDVPDAKTKSYLCGIEGVQVLSKQRLPGRWVFLRQAHSEVLHGHTVRPRRPRLVGQSQREDRPAP